MRLVPAIIVLALLGLCLLACRVTGEDFDVHP
jgi:hypothetical protein